MKAACRVIPTVAERDPLYASVADVTVDTDGRRAAQVADEILGRIAEVCPEELAEPA